ncbi:MAG: flavodoxin [Treponema sp.]|jgi:flavodoxin short chain|nr:flavodoxin [Treponema sp.]
MKKILIAYWSGTGNTELMAKRVAQGVTDAGGEALLKNAAETTPALVKEAAALAFGCPAMGAEVLEEGEMEPLIAALGSAEAGAKALGLFGSYDWGDGQWMRDWVDRMKSLGAQVDGEGIIARLEPDDDSLTRCYELGKRLAGKAELAL